MISKESMKWNKCDSGFDAWFFETDQRSTAAWLEKNNDGQWEAIIAVPYHINDDGEEQDAEFVGVFSDLSQAMLAAQRAASYTVHGEMIF